MSGDDTDDAEVQRDERRDEVKETTTDPHLGVKVETAVRKGHEENQELAKVYVPRQDAYGSLFDDGTETVTRYVKVAEFPTSVATEVLFGLAHSHGYELEGK